MNKDIDELCQLYELYGAITEARDRQIQKIGLDNYPSKETIIKLILKLKKKIKKESTK